MLAPTSTTRGASHRAPSGTWGGAAAGWRTGRARPEPRGKLAPHGDSVGQEKLLHHLLTTWTARARVQGRSGTLRRTRRSSSRPRPRRHRNRTLRTFATLAGWAGALARIGGAGNRGIPCLSAAACGSGCILLPAPCVRRLQQRRNSPAPPVRQLMPGA
eukprot:scaffold11792_cov112-Isochrysis_galbana.AAC.5